MFIGTLKQSYQVVFSLIGETNKEKKYTWDELVSMASKKNYQTLSSKKEFFIYDENNKRILVGKGVE